MNFGQAIEQLKDGKKVARGGWNGKGMWTAAQQWQPGWLASQADILAEDWSTVI